MGSLLRIRSQDYVCWVGPTRILAWDNVFDEESRDTGVDRDIQSMRYFNKNGYQVVLTLSSTSHSDPTLKSENATVWLWVHMPG